MAPENSGNQKRRQLLQRLLEREGLATPEARRAAAPAEAPLSFSQQRLWYLSRLEPESRAYHISKAFRLSGQLDIDALRRSLDEVLQRHSVLRTTCHDHGGEPVQQVSETRFEVGFTDLGQLDPATATLRAAEICRQLDQRLFDLSAELPIRAHLVRIGPEDHLLALTIHHIATDGWSSNLLLKELSSLYNAFCNGLASPLAPLPLQYAGYARWQRSRAASPEFRAGLETLKETLEGAPRLSTFPLDHERPEVSAHSGARHPIRVPAALVRQLETLGRNEGATLYMVLLAALKLLLHHYSGQGDLVIGSPTAGRIRTDLEPLIGFFVNNLVIRTRLSDELPFRRLLQRVRTSCLAAYEWHEVPFERLVEELHPPRSLNHSPVFQVSFSFHNQPQSNLDLAGLKVEPIELEAHYSKFDWALSLRARDGSLTGAVEYDRGLFDPDTIRNHLSDFQLILEAIVANPDVRDVDLPPIRPPASTSNIEPLETPDLRTDDVPTATPAAAQGEAERKMLEIWREVLGRQDIGPDDNYFELGGTSMQSLRLLSRVAAVFGRQLPASTVFTAGSAAGFVRRLQEDHRPEDVPVIAARAKGSRPPLFLAPGHDGDQFTLATLLRHLPSDQPLYGLEPLGFVGESSLQLTELARRYLDGIRSMQPAGPYLLAGYCSGAAVAWEMASQLTQSGQRVGLLALIDSRGPHRNRSAGAVLRGLRGVQRALGELRTLSEVSSGNRLQHAANRLARARRRAAFIGLGALGGDRSWLPERLKPLLNEMKSIDGVIALHRTAHSGYSPEPFEGPCLLLQPTRPLIGLNGANGWAALAGSHLEVRRVPGYNNKLLSEPYVRYTASELASAITRALQE